MIKNRKIGPQMLRAAAVNADAVSSGLPELIKFERADFDATDAGE